jgi:hypothetical protein
MMEMIPNWLVSNWDKFSIWVTNQPTFVEVAFGVGLFYLVLGLVYRTPQVQKEEKKANPSQRYKAGFYG